LFVGDPAVAREIMVSRSKEIIKPIHVYKILDIFGKNVVTTEHDEWRRHRRIAAPTFSEGNNMLVHKASVDVAERMFKGWDSTGEAEFLVNASEDMMQAALAVISIAAFGMDFPWHAENDSKLVPNGHKLSFKRAIQTVIETLHVKLLTPSWLYVLPIKALQVSRLAFQEFDLYLDEIIQSAKGDDTKKNLVHMLVNATEGEEGKLTRSELKGNAFIYIFAGHETTAGTLAFALAALAVYPDIQEKLHKAVVAELGDSEPEYSDFSKLKYSLAIMNETLRHYPPVTGIPKFTADKEAVIGDVVVPANTMVTIVTPGIQFCPSVWGDDVEAFNPDRFIDSTTGEVHAFGGSALGLAPFSEGPRSCLGKKFAQVEFVALLSMMSLRYKWRVPEGVKGEDLLMAAPVITLKPAKDVKLVFSRR
ncbi:cytochrome P450, partial [Chytriomyces sp. MP71]